MQIGSVQSGSLNLGAQASKASQASSLAYYDPKDTNKDGVVSAAEELAYSQKHPEVEVLKRLRTPSSHSNQKSASASLAWYTTKGTKSTTSQAVSGALDLYA
jgi:hypothetical protein